MGGISVGPTHILVPRKLYRIAWQLAWGEWVKKRRAFLRRRRGY